MKVNAQRVRVLREDRSWTQEALARAAGLNLRTVQRIENESSASRSSLRALAAAFGIDVRELDDADDGGRYEFRLMEIEPSEGLPTGTRSPDLAGLLRVQGEEGWMLVQILPPELAERLSAGRTGRFVAVLQRPSPATDDEVRSARTRR